MSDKEKELLETLKTREELERRGYTREVCTSCNGVGINHGWPCLSCDGKGFHWVGTFR